MWGFNFVNLHFHGVDFSPKIEDLRSHVDGGESKTYTFVVPEDKEPGLCWYHNHVHGTAVYSYLASLFGMIIVEGTESDLTKAVGVEEAREVLLIFSDGLVNPDGSVLPSFPVFANFNWTGVTNGHLGEQTVYNVTQGERVLFRATSATSEAIVRLSIPNVTFIVLANDGLVLFEPQETDVILIPGGGRVEFLAQFDEPGTHVMTRAAWSPMFPDAEACAAGGFPFYPCWSFDIDQVAATIVVTENPSFIAPTEALVDSVQLPDVPQRLLSLAATEPVDTKTFIFQIVGAFPIFQIPYDGEFVPPGVGFGVNGRLLTPNYVEGNVTEGTCETWNVVSDPPGAEHAFHIHQATFFVQAIDGVALENPTWHDTIMIQQNATIHICFDRAEAGDAILAHCHAPNHFDIGMGATYNVVPSKSTPSPLANGTSPNPPAAPPLTGSNASVSPVAAPSSSNEGSGTTVHFHLAPLAGLAAMILFFT